MRQTFRTCTIAATLLLASTTAFAQEFTWTSTTVMKLGSVPGVIAKMLGSGKENTETSYLSGHKLRVDMTNFAHITDADAGTLTTLDSKKKTYNTMTFDQLAAAAQVAAADAKKEELPQMKFEVKVARPGEKATIAGIAAERVIITVLGRRDPAAKQRPDQGDMAFVIDAWSASEAPHAAALRGYQQAVASKLARDPATAGLESLFSQYDGMAEGWQSAWAELRKANGTFIKTTTYVASLPQGVTLDQDALFNPKPEAKEGAGSRLGRGLLGRVAGGAGGGEKKPETPVQSLLVSLASELKEVKQGGVSADLFVVPAGYKEVKK